MADRKLSLSQELSACRKSFEVKILQVKTPTVAESNYRTAYNNGVQNWLRQE